MEALFAKRNLKRSTCVSTRHIQTHLAHHGIFTRPLPPSAVLSVDPSLALSDWSQRQPHPAAGFQKSR